MIKKAKSKIEHIFKSKETTSSIFNLGSLSFVWLRNPILEEGKGSSGWAQLIGCKVFYELNQVPNFHVTLQLSEILFSYAYGKQKIKNLNFCNNVISTNLVTKEWSNLWLIGCTMSAPSTLASAMNYRKKNEKRKKLLHIYHVKITKEYYKRIYSFFIIKVMPVNFSNQIVVRARRENEPKQILQMYWKPPYNRIFTQYIQIKHV